MNERKEAPKMEECKALPQESTKPAELTDSTVWLTSENAAFAERDGLLYLRQGERETRVIPVRAFPFETLWEYIAILDERRGEIGMVRAMSALSEESRACLERELKRRYYVLTIRRILSVKERYGFSYWRVETDEGEVSFTVHDVFRSMIRVGEDRVFLLDVDGNRFEIPSLAGLDRRSMRRIELYL